MNRPVDFESPASSGASKASDDMVEFQSPEEAKKFFFPEDYSRSGDPDVQFEMDIQGILRELDSIKDVAKRR